MSKSKITSLIRKIKNRIVRVLNPEKIILFGSYAYGNPTKNSDIDLLIIMKSRERPAQRRIKASRLFWDRPAPMDFIVKTPAEVKQRLTMGDFFMRKVLQKGKVLYAKKTR